jgi:hypothetical protein
LWQWHPGADSKRRFIFKIELKLVPSIMGGVDQEFTKNQLERTETGRGELGTFKTTRQLQMRVGLQVLMQLSLCLREKRAKCCRRI